MKILETLFLLITVGSCNNTLKNDISIIQNKKAVVEDSNSIVELVEDNKKAADFYFSRSGELIKINEYLINGELENEIHFKYTNHKIDFVFLGNNNKFKDEWLTNYYMNIEFYNDFLIKKKVKIDNPFMLANEVNDLQILITNIDEFKKINKKNETIYRSKKINLKIRFSPSKIERFIPQSSRINNFEYTVDNQNFLIREDIKFSDGTLTIKYIYKDHKIDQIVYSLKYSNGELLESNKKYH